MEHLKLVREFHEAFEIPNLSVTDKAQLYMIIEELDEYYDALNEGDRVAIADVLIDLTYFILGAWHRHGFTPKQFVQCFEEVHASNMSKIENGKVLRRKDGKVLKGKDYFEPNLKQYIK